MSTTRVTPLSPPVLLGLVRAARDVRETRVAAAKLSRTEPAEAPLEMPTIREREPFAVERLPAVGDAVHLVGYDGRGKPLLQLVMPARRVTKSVVKRMQTWLMEDEEQPPTPPSIELMK